MRLSRAARLAAEPNTAGRMIRTQDAMHREDPVRHDAAEPAEPPILALDPLQRETEEPDYSLSVWRNDHTTERDRRAHEKLRSAIDERAAAA